MMFDEKRGQSSIFIIAGIVIVIVVVLIVFFTREDVQVGERITSTQVEPIREYIEGCIEDELNEKVPLLKKYGGYYTLVNTVPQGDINYFTHVKDGVDIEKMLSNSIREKLKKDCNLNVFQDNFDLSYDPDLIFVEVDIQDFLVEAIVEYPIMIRKDEFSTNLDVFRISYDSDLGILLRVARDFFEFYYRTGKTSYDLKSEFYVTGVSHEIRRDAGVKFYVVKGGEPGLPFTFAVQQP
ncbi:hypothetical protein J4229_03860 [Candidatus Pacearchaeota archaeon]|nr:hypothetical protein [Candidatus Pacearchaeota archaeon]